MSLLQKELWSSSKPGAKHSSITQLATFWPSRIQAMAPLPDWYHLSLTTKPKPSHNSASKADHELSTCILASHSLENGKLWKLSRGQWIAGGILLMMWPKRFHHPPDCMAISQWRQVRVGAGAQCPVGWKAWMQVWDGMSKKFPFVAYHLPEMVWTWVI